jgi:hypothetical protein
MIRENEMQNRDMDEEPINPPIMDNESQGHKAESIVIEFLQSSDMGFGKVDRTSMFDRNDKDGVDAVCEIAGDGKIALDITFNKSKLMEKLERDRRTPCIYLHDEKGKIISEEIPRALIYDLSPVNWITYMDEAAKKHGGNLVGAMPNSFLLEKQKLFLTQILSVANELSASTKYREKFRSAKKIIKERLDKMAA